jgi:hypothetical protein
MASEAAAAAPASEAELPGPLNSYIQKKEAEPSHPVTEEEFNNVGRAVEQQMECGGPCPAPAPPPKAIIVIVPADR